MRPNTRRLKQRVFSYQKMHKAFIVVKISYEKPHLETRCKISQGNPTEILQESTTRDPRSLSKAVAGAHLQTQRLRSGLIQEHSFHGTGVATTRGHHKALNRALSQLLHEQLEQLEQVQSV